MSSPEHSPRSLEAPNSYDSDKGNNSILTLLQSEPTSCTKKSPLRTALGKAFEMAVKTTAPPTESETDHVKVFLRLRPTAANEESCIEVRSDGCSVRATAPPPINQKKEFKEARDYSFTKVMDESSSQSDVYDQAAKDIVKSFCDDGKSGLMFTYGVTNAGKSFTVLGNQTQPGLLPRSLENVCANLKESDILSVSYMEIYNEQIYDLLDSSDQPTGVTKSNSFNSAFSSLSSAALDRPRKNLMIRDRGGKVVVDGLSHHKITTAEQAMALIDSGSKSRQTCSHNLNSDSSRSHSVCTIELIRNGKRMTPSELGGYVPAVLYIVDLAGSERGERTGAGGVSKKQTEANSINTSLFTLMTCLGSLRESTGGHSKRGSSAMSTARYRESKLTRLLAPHLSGNSCGPGGAGTTCMIVNANPRGSDFIETCYVLSQTAPCTKIKIKNQNQNNNSQNSLLSAAQKFDMNGRKIIKGVAMAGLSTAANTMNSGSIVNGKNLHKKRSITYEASHPMTRRARLTSNDSIESLDSTRSSNSTFLTKRSISLNYENEISSLKTENEMLKLELNQVKEEAENNEITLRDECADAMEALMEKYHNNAVMTTNSSSILTKSNSLSSVAEDDENKNNDISVPVVIDILQSARKKKKQEDIQQMFDDLQDKCDDLEEELIRSTAENKALTIALNAARQENDNKLINEETGELMRVPERWVMLDFLTQLLTAPNTLNIEEFNCEQAGLTKALENVSFSSPMRNCALKIEEYDDDNKVEKMAQELRNALKLNSLHDENDLKEIMELKHQLKSSEEYINRLKKSLVCESSEVDSETVCSKLNTNTDQEEEMEAMVVEAPIIEEEEEEEAAEAPMEENSLISSSSVSMNPLIANDSPQETSTSSLIPPPPKIITQLAPIDPNSPVKSKPSEKVVENSGKYSPSVLGNMSKRIREKAVKKSKKGEDKKKVLKASPRRTRSSTLFLRV